MPSEVKNDVEGMIRVLTLLWIAFLAATVAYVGVGALIHRSRGEAGMSHVDLRLVRPVFWIAGTLGLGIALLLRRRLLARAFRDGDAALIGVQSALVVGWAAVETVALIGLVLILLGGSLIDAAPFFLASFLVIARQRPTSGWLLERVGGYGTGGRARPL